uniref:Ig-like domain-containing protein n=1 Tax=Mesocestoides corti TaxID=53468 RepID=A0A5K3EWR9_MESCO
MREDMSKVITCQTDEGGANPAVNITWRHLSPLGAPEKLEEDMQISSGHRKGTGGGIVSHSNLTIRAHRRLNGHRIECSIEKPGQITLLRKSETLDVIFAPNSVQIHPSVSGGVSEGDAISLTCAVAVSNPPAMVRWFEFPPGAGGESDSGREITDLAQIDLTPGEYGGMLVDSTLSVSKTFRSNSQTEYRCVVNQDAIKKPVVAEYKLNILYPPSVEIVSLPNDPTEGQSVTLSCLSHGGVPDKGFSFSWWHTKDLQLPETVTQNPSSSSSKEELSSVVAKSLLSTLNTTQLAEMFASHMTQIPNHTGRHLMLDGISLEQAGWYGCQVSSGGGIARSLRLLLINYAPKIHASTKFIQYAQPGLKAEFVLTVEARPARAEYMWFWIGDDSALASKARGKILSQSSAQASSHFLSRRSISPLKAISTSTVPWVNRVKQTSSKSGDNRLTFTLAFREVLESDFGIYMCQVNHKSGTREFYFELKPQTHSKGINPDSIRITSEGRKVRVEFEPPNSQFYSRIVLRICLPVHLTSGSGRTVRPSEELVFLRPVKDSSGGPAPSSVDVLAAASNNDECGDYEVTFAELGFLQVELDKPIADYTFQFLVYQDKQLRQITRPIRWNKDDPPQTSATSKLLVQLIIGILITLLVVCLIAFLIYYFCSCLKRRNMKKLAPATSNGLLHGTRTYQTLDMSKSYGSPPSGAGSISADIGLLHPAYARQSLGTGSPLTGPIPTLSVSSSINEDNENRRTPGSSCQSTKGFYAPQSTGHMASSAHPLLENTYHPMQNNEMRSSPSNTSHVSALTQRILSEVYIAAAKAASIAVSESIASGSMDAVNQPVGGPGSYRPGSQCGESVSMIGGSISALDGLGGYPASTSNGAARMRKSPNTRTVTPTYQGHLTPQQVLSQQILRPRMPSQMGYGWNSPLLTAQATMRLNEAASALAAAAAAAVLEATGATPDLNSQGPTTVPHVSRFSGGGGGVGGGGQGTSSEDGESISSSSFFPRTPNSRLNSQDATTKVQRKKVLQGARKGSLSNSGNEFLIPMLAVPPNYPQVIDPRGGRTPPSEMTCLSTSPLDGTWIRGFQPIQNPRTGEEPKFNPYPQSEAASNTSALNVPTFVTSSTPTTARRSAINPQPPSSNASYTAEDGNPNDNTLRANADQSFKPPPQIMQAEKQEQLPLPSPPPSSETQQYRE